MWGILTSVCTPCLCELIPNNFYTCLQTLRTHPEELLAYFSNHIWSQCQCQISKCGVLGIEMPGARVGYCKICVPTTPLKTHPKYFLYLSTNSKNSSWRTTRNFPKPNMTWVHLKVTVRRGWVLKCHKSQRWYNTTSGHLGFWDPNVYVKHSEIDTQVIYWLENIRGVL